MNLYEAIFKRRSVRQFDMNPLSAELLTEITNYLLSIKQIDGTDHASFVLAEEKMTTGGIRAPHYFLAGGQNNQGACINAGYVLAELDLYLQNKGLGSIFLGFTKPIRKTDKAGFIISFGFGNSTEPLRKSADDFKRLGIDTISNTDNLITQTARLAPSAVNSQP
jgi:nitroreductase